MEISLSSPTISPLVPLYIAQALFGVLYAALIHWLSKKGYLKGSTAWSVVIGVGGTLCVQWLFVRECWGPLATFGSFAVTGTPMTVTYLVRHEQRKLSHKRRILTGSGARARDEVVMDLVGMAKQIADEERSVASVVNDLHCFARTLKSL